MNIRTAVLSTFISLLSGSLCFAQAQEPEQNLNKKEIKVLIDSLGNAMNRRYIYPDKAALMVGNVEKNYRDGSYNNVKSRKELSVLLDKDLQQAYKDKHLEIAYDPRLANELETYKSDTASNRKAYERDLKKAQNNSFAFRKAEILPGNIGYLRWDGFYGLIDEAMPTVNGAFHFIGNTRALIIDMRFNRGGAPPMTLQMQSYFFQQKTHMNDYIDRNNDTIQRWADPATTDFKLNMPVYVLTSHATFSGGEDFTYGLQCAKRATIVGDTTGGGAHATRPFSLGQGFVAFIPTQRCNNVVTQTDWEGTGVYPDVPVPADQALIKAQSLIYSELLSKATDEREESMLQWNLTSLENKTLLAKQIQKDDIKMTREDLLKYCGEYNPADLSTSTTTVFIILTGNHLCRHLPDGANDVRLVPISASKFVYDNDSGLTIEFVKDKNGDILNMILTAPDGVHTKNKKK